MKLSINYFIKVNKRPLLVKQNIKGMFFTCWNRKHYFDDILRLHNNEFWIKDVYPEQLHGQVIGYNLYIEIVNDGCECFVNAYARRPEQ